MKKNFVQAANCANKTGEALQNKKQNEDNLLKKQKRNLKKYNKIKLDKTTTTIQNIRTIDNNNGQNTNLWNSIK